MAFNKLNVVIGANIEALQKELRKVEKDLQRFGRNMQRIGTDLTQLISVPIAGLGLSFCSRRHPSCTAIQYTSCISEKESPPKSDRLFPFDSKYRAIARIEKRTGTDCLLIEIVVVIYVVVCLRFRTCVDRTVNLGGKAIRGILFRTCVQRQVGNVGTTGKKIISHVVGSKSPGD